MILGGFSMWLCLTLFFSRINTLDLIYLSLSHLLLHYTCTKLRWRERQSNRLPPFRVSKCRFWMLKIPVLVGGLGWRPCFHDNSSCRGFFVAVDSIFSVSEQGVGGGRNGGVGCGCSFTWQMESFYSLLAFSHWMTSALSHKAKRSRKSVSWNTKPIRFCEQFSARKTSSFEECVRAIWQWWGRWFWCVHDLEEPTCRVWRTLLDSWHFTR